ncbi:MAG: DASH family cryptochrome [Flammeovirgaceae bacterium]
MDTLPIIVWFRNDLRLHDNEALWKASQKTTKIVPFYCFDIRQYQKLPDLQIPKTGAFRTQFLKEGVEDLRKNLKKLGGNLIVRVGKPEEEVCKIALETQAKVVYTSKEVTTEEIEVEKQLENLLLKNKIEIKYFWQSTLYHLEDLPFPVHNIPEIFTNFRKEVERQTKVRTCYPSPKNLPTIDIEEGKIPTLETLGLQPSKIDKKAVIQFVGGESHGIGRLQEYIWEKDLLKNYKNTRNGLLGADYSSKFSAWLSLGFLSPRYIFEQVKSYEASRIANESTYWLIFELIWRDYFRFIAKKHGNKLFLRGGIQNQLIKTNQDMKTFWLWANGKTGVPFVDANMTELNKTGFMSNRGRQNVASFLIKDLKIDWRWGASYFESKLIDYDVCSNWGNWNYIAGIGNDPRKDRYFNVSSQAQQYDPKKEYVNYWLSN